MTTYVFAVCDKHNVKCFSLMSATGTLTGKSWIRRLQDTHCEAAAGRDVGHLKKTPEELSRSDFWITPRNAFGNGRATKAARETLHLLVHRRKLGGSLGCKWGTTNR